MMTRTIGNPLSWTFGAMASGLDYLRSTRSQLAAGSTAEVPSVRYITVADLWTVLRKGLDDLAAFRSDVLFVCLVYPAIGILLAGMALNGNLLPLVFPVISGFALIGPFAAVGLYEMSRRRERGEPTSWLALVDVIKSPRFAGIFMLGMLHIFIFIVWIMAANLIFDATLGPEAPASVSAFLTEALTTTAGWAMIAVGGVVGFGFAVGVLAISAVSFPMLLDRDVSLPVAVVTSIRVAQHNPVPIAVWGLIVAVSLAIGSLPLLLGLVLVMPLLGHSAWHLYRATVAAP